MTNKITMEEYEALATMRDLALILRDNINERIGHDSKSLERAFLTLDGLTSTAHDDQF